MIETNTTIVVFGSPDNGYIFDNMQKYWATHALQVDFANRFPLLYVGKFLRYRLRGGRIVHFNFVGGYYSDHRLWLTFIKSLLWLLSLVVMKVVGLKFVWTIHNTLPHEEFHPWLTRPVRKIFYHLCNEVVVHGKRQQLYTETLFGVHPRMHCIPLGNVVREKYRDGSLTFPSRQEARERLQIPDGAFLFLAFGKIRPYKQLELLLEAFIEHAKGFSNSMLYIVGQSASEEYRQQLLRISRQSSSVRWHFDYVPDDKLGEFLTAADSICITNDMYGMTENVYWAMYYEKPIIGGNIGCLGEIIEEKQLGLVYEAGQQEGLLRALQRMRTLTDEEHTAMIEHLRSHKDDGDWDTVAQAYVEKVYAHYLT